jgi:hypothetical protein
VPEKRYCKRVFWDGGSESFFHAISIVSAGLVILCKHFQKIVFDGAGNAGGLRMPHGSFRRQIVRDAGGSKPFVGKSWENEWVDCHDK